MNEQVKVSDRMVIAAYLEDRTAGKFLRATVQDIDGNELSDSPLTLTDLGGGLYRDKSLIKQRGKFFVTIQVFDDAGFTEPNEDFEDLTMQFGDPPFTVLTESPINIDIAEPDRLDLDVGSDTIDINIVEPDRIDIDIICD